MSSPGPYGFKYRAPSGAHYLVSVDLGKTKVGVAVWLVSDAPPIAVYYDTIFCAQGTGPDLVAKAVTEFALRAVHLADLPVKWACEWPLKYPDKTLYHEDLDSLHAVGAAMEDLNGRWTKKVYPGKWKGNVPKPPHHRRVRRALLEGEHLGGDEPPKKEHDTWDALGIGAYLLGITERGGARP